MQLTTHRPIWRRRILAWAMIVALAACGGGSTWPALQGVKWFVSQIPAAEPTAARMRVQAATALESAGGITPGALLDWAEYKFPSLFAVRVDTLPSVDYDGKTFYARIYSYPGGLRYLGVTTDGRVFGLGDFTDEALKSYGVLADWEAQVSADQCGVNPASCTQPSIATQPISQAVTAPAPASFSVAATGIPTPTYQWQVSTDAGASFTNIGAATSSTYTKSPTTASDNAAAFRVVVANGAGTVVSSAATLTVHRAISSYDFTALAAVMVTGRVMHTATLLSDGKVLITGGFAAATFPAPALNLAELYDPVTNAFTAIAATMRSARTEHAATLLPDGQVLLTGGQADNNDGDGVNTAELYDPTSRTFTAVASRMTSPRGGHTATLLPNGKVLLAAGYYRGAGTLTTDAELYDPTTKTFTALNARMVTVRASHSATLLQGGKVLVVGGSTNGGVVDSTEWYDPATETFTAIAAKTTARRAGHEATLLPNGLLLLTGGAPVFSPAGLVVLNSAEVFDPTTQAFTSIAATMVAPRVGHAAARLLDGSVLLTGGGNVTGAGGGFAVLKTAERYRVASGIE